MPRSKSPLRTEEGRFAPAGDGIQVARVGFLLDQLAPVHVDTDAAAIDLGDAQMHQFDQMFAERTLFDGSGQVDHRLQVGGGKCEERDAGCVGHDVPFA